jgi:hypothetical protein
MFELASTSFSLPGWHHWFDDADRLFHIKQQYHGESADLPSEDHHRASLLTVGVPLCSWRIFYVGASPEAALASNHWIYFVGTALMIVGAILEGFFGGRLSHRPRIPLQQRDNAG